MIVDLYLVYSFIKRLSTPFNKWDAYDLGIIDENGEQLKKRKELRTVKERDAFGLFDLMILKLKKLMSKVPGGSSRIASYAAALYLIKEHDEIKKNGEFMSEEMLEQKLNEYIENYEVLKEDVGVQNVAGIGVGPDGEPGVTPKQSKRYKKKNQDDAPKVVGFKERFKGL